MSVEARLTAALKELPYVIFPDFYDRNKAYFKNGNPLTVQGEWITWNEISTTADRYADDEELSSATAADVHFFTKDKATAKKVGKQLVSLLQKTELIVRGRRLTYENDTGFYHFTLEVLSLEETED